MNGTCAGGTGAFIDQMATLLDLTIEEMDELSLRHTRIYPIASRCGVFAKTDIQPLLNRGCRQGKHCRQHLCRRCQPDHRRTGAGTAHRRKSHVPGRSPVLLSGLRAAFREALKLDDKHALFPE